MVTSTTEAEYFASCTATKESVCFKRLLTGIGYPQTNPTVINIDNNGARRLIENLEFHKRIKHIAVQYHYVREVQEAGENCPAYLPIGQ